jgi:hypothetical protein
MKRDQKKGYKRRPQVRFLFEIHTFGSEQLWGKTLLQHIVWSTAVLFCIKSSSLSSMSSGLMEYSISIIIITC